MDCYIYVLGSRDDVRTYVGWTVDLDQRLKQHNAGTGAKSTRGRQWEILYAERHQTRSAAMSREWHLKRDRAFRKIVADVKGFLLLFTGNRFDFDDLWK